MPPKRQGIRLKLGGAPPTPHTLAGVPGQVRPDLPSPVGQPGDAIPDLAQAQKIVQERKDVLELVEIAASDVTRAEEQAKQDIADSQNSLVEARKDGRAADDLSRFKDEQTAVKAKPEGGQ